MLALPPGAPMLASVDPLTILVTLTAALKPESWLPLPRKKVPAMLPAESMLPVAETKPVVRKLPACTFPLALTVTPCTKVVAITLPPVTLPVALTKPPVNTLPPVTLPVTPSVVPTVAALATANVPLPPNALATL